MNNINPNLRQSYVFLLKYKHRVVRCEYGTWLKQYGLRITLDGGIEYALADEGKPLYFYCLLSRDK